MATGAEILSYVGNANLGLGSNPSIPGLQREDTDMSDIHQAFRDVMMIDHENQMMQFQQKIKDRDDLRKMLEDGQVPSGEIDPEYRPIYDKAEEEVTTAFDNIKGLNDEKGLQEYYRKVRNLKDVTTHAQERTIMTKALEVDKAKSTLPSEVTAKDEFIKGQKSKPFWERIEPYQPDFSFTTEPILKTAEYVTASKPATLTNPFDVTVSTFNYDGTRRSLDDLYTRNVEDAEHMRRLTNAFQSLPPERRIASIEAMNKRIEKYNNEIGLQKGMEGYAPPIQFDTKTGLIRELPADFAAKYVLANQEQFSSQQQKFNKDIGAFNLGKEKNAIADYNARTGRLNYLLRKNQADKQDAQMQAFSQVWDNIIPNLIYDVSNANSMYGSPFKIPIASLPQGYLYNMGLDKDGKPIKLIGKDLQVLTDKDGKPLLDKNKNPIYNEGSGYVTPQFFIPKGATFGNVQVGKDTQLSPEQISNYAKQAGYSNVKDFIMDLTNKGMLDFDLEGGNGKATRGSSFITQMGSANKSMSQKFDVNPYEAVPLMPEENIPPEQ